MEKKYAIIGIVIIAVALIYFVSSSGNAESKTDMTIYKSSTCGCCNGWAGYARNEYDINIIEYNVDAIKDEHNIPQNMRSCHTTMVEGYFVEGHVPLEAVNKMLEEQPDIDGIALPRMPSGSPGMPGVKQGEWIIYAIKDGEASEFMRI